MNELLDQDSPLAHYKHLFPNDKNAEEAVLHLLWNTANEVTGEYLIDLEDIESKGLSRLELDIYTNIKIDALREEEIV